MKCQKCNHNEANVHYTETINGETREICLCSECAKETGILERTNSMFEEMEREMLSAFTLPFGGSIFNRRPIFGRVFPQIGTMFEVEPEELPKAKEPAEAVSKEDSLKAQLLDAIAEERYEDAAKLRDEIKKLSK